MHNPYNYHGQVNYQSRGYYPNQYMPPPGTPYPPFAANYNATRQDAREGGFIPPISNAATVRTANHRRAESALDANPTPHLKPALKKPQTAPPSVEPLTRQQSNQMSRSQMPPMYHNPLTELVPVTDPNFRPHHMFMLFIGDNELKLENITQPAMVEIRQCILPLWPRGVESDTQHGYDWSVKFRDSPWTSRGPDFQAWKLVLELFVLFARRGFTFQTIVNSGNSTPRLIFEISSADENSQFFLAYFSKSGRRFTMVNPPDQLRYTVDAHLRDVLPHRIKTAENAPRELRVMELKKWGTPGASQVEPSLFLMHILKIISNLGFQLVTSVPLGRRLLSRSPRTELFIFRGSTS